MREVTVDARSRSGIGPGAEAEAGSASRPDHEPATLPVETLPLPLPTEDAPCEADGMASAALSARRSARRCYRSVKLWLCRRCAMQTWVNALGLCLPCQEESWWAEDNRRVCNWIHRGQEPTDT